MDRGCSSQMVEARGSRRQDVDPHAARALLSARRFSRARRGAGAEAETPPCPRVSSSARGPVQLLPDEELQRSPEFLLCHPHHSCPGPVHDRRVDGEPAPAVHLPGGPCTPRLKSGNGQRKGHQGFPGTSCVGQWIQNRKRNTSLGGNRLQNRRGPPVLWSLDPNRGLYAR